MEDLFVFHLLEFYKNNYNTSLLYQFTTLLTVNSNDRDISVDFQHFQKPKEDIKKRF